MIRLLHISDVHLGARLGGFEPVAEERREAIRAAFRRLPARADDWGVDAVLVSGDLFESPRPARRDVDVARETLRGLAEARPVFAIPGNHDPAVGSDSPWRNMPDVVSVCLASSFGRPTTLSVRGESLHVYGLAHDPSSEDDPLEGFHRNEDEGLHVVLLHAGVIDHPDWSGGDGLQVTTGRLAALDVDYIALGDHHRFRPPEEFGGVPACYAGSFAAVAVDEVGPRGCAVVELSTDAPPRVRLEPTSVPALVDVGGVDVGDATSDLEAADRVGSAMTAGDGYPVATLTGEPPFPLDIERVRENLRERFGFAVVRDDTRFIDSETVRALADRPTVAGHVTRLGLERIERAEDDGARATAQRALRLALGALDAEPS